MSPVSLVRNILNTFETKTIVCHFKPTNGITPEGLTERLPLSAFSGIYIVHVYFMSPRDKRFIYRRWVEGRRRNEKSEAQIKREELQRWMV